jgi:hypothetical protein
MAGRGLVRQTVARLPAAELKRLSAGDEAMNLGNVKRLVLVAVAAALIVGAWASVGTAVRTPKVEPTFSESDCETIQNIEVKDSSGGYWGKSARNAAAAFSDAAQDVDNKKLRKAMNTLAGVWRTVGRETSAIAAAKVTLKAGKKYGDALGTYTKAQITCSTQDINDAFDEATTTTEPLADDSSSTSTDDGSSSSSD